MISQVLAANPSMQKIKARKVQRLSPDGRVKPQANGGRKMVTLEIGIRNSLRTE